MKRFFNWLVTSSKDPRKYAATAKGAVMVAGSQIVKAFDLACQFGLACLGVEPTTINQIAEGTEAVVYGGLLFIGGAVMLFGIARKIYYTRWSAAKL